MPVLTINLNIIGLVNFSYQYKKSADPAMIWTQGTATASPFTITTTDPKNTNYDFQIYNTCSSSTSLTTAFSTHYVCDCNIVNAVSDYGSSLKNGGDHLCNPVDNSYYVWFAVQYQCMRDDMNVLKSIVRITIDNISYTFIPTYSDSTAINSIAPGGAAVIGEVFSIKLDSDGALKTAIIDCITS